MATMGFMSQQRTPEPEPRIPTDSIANRLILARALAGHMSIREAALLCNIGRGAWQNWERGYSTPRINDVRAIAEGLGVDLTWLAQGGPLGVVPYPKGPDGGNVRKLPRRDSNTQPAGYVHLVLNNAA
jgi:transcriptional regulator with XRE-family HTH domain